VLERRGYIQRRWLRLATQTWLMLTKNPNVEVQLWGGCSCREAIFFLFGCVICATCNKGKGSRRAELTRQKLMAHVKPVFSALLRTCV
jgi:hypothetical protein